MNHISMRAFLILLALFTLGPTVGYAADPEPFPAATVATVPVPEGTPAVPSVAVAKQAAPPAWAQDVIVAAEKFPLIGPWLTKIMLWLGILSGILTTLVGAVLGILGMLKGALNVAGLTRIAAIVTNFRDGQVMYWLKFFSMFNATKPDASVVVPPAPISVVKS